VSTWSVYVLRTARADLYTGISTDVDERLAAHAAGRGAKCLRGRGPFELVYRRRLGQVGLALRVERALKRLSKADKEALAAARPTRTRLLRILGLAPARPKAPKRLKPKSAAPRA